MKVIPSLKYCREHTWVKIEGEYAYIGITDYAQDQLGEILFVEMPEVEDDLYSILGAKEQIDCRACFAISFLNEHHQ